MKIIKFIPCLLIVLVGLSGCFSRDEMDELSAMGQYSRESDTQHRMVKVINAHYDLLCKAIAKGAINAYVDKLEFLNSFGAPILKKDLGQGQERWLYRYAIYRLAKDKVYVYFDRNGKMIRWEKLPCPKFF